MVKLFSVGDLNMDLFFYTGEKPVLGTEKRVQKISYTLGGNAANFAMASASLGLETFLISVLGKDVFTSYLKKELGKAGVKPLLFESQKPNGVSGIFVAKTGERGIMSNKGCLEELTCTKIGKRLFPKLGKGDIVFFGGYFHLESMKKGFPELLKKIRKKGAKVFFDTTYDENEQWDLKGAMKYIDLLFVNEMELKKLSGLDSTEKGIKSLSQ